MLCINLTSTDPYFNLAIEEVLLKNSEEEYLILYINTTSLIIGKHQSPHREVNTKFVYENKIPVIRRISGGGTVFHDEGNLNFTFIQKSEAGKQVDFRKYTKPVIDFLCSLGINAKFEGKNDIKINGSKISGNAEHIFRNRVLHHGTLLFNTSFEKLGRSIRSDTSNYTTRAVKSNPSSVINLQEKLTYFPDISEFRSEMLNYFLRNLKETIPYEIPERETKEAESLAVTRYNTWEWNWSYGPEYTFNNNFLFKGTWYSCSLFVRDGIIWKCSIEGSDNLISASKKLIGCRHMVEDLTALFIKENIEFSMKEIFNFF
jgi:lipoate-protein ligase A